MLRDIGEEVLELQKNDPIGDREVGKELEEEKVGVVEERNDDVDAPDVENIVGEEHREKMEQEEIGLQKEGWVYYVAMRTR